MVNEREKILAWENRQFEFNTQVVEGVDCIVDPFPVISETDNLLVLHLTQIELTQLLSSIQVGAEFCYPDISQQILFNFWKGLICMDICQEIADCIDNPESPARSSVTNVTNENITNNNYLVTPDREIEPDAPNFIEKRFKSIDRELPVMPDGETCDSARKDEIYGGVLEIVNRLSEMAQDMLEDLNAQADSVQRAARAVAIVPLIGDIAGETILAFAEIVPDLLNLYLSHDSQSQREDVACDLFCLHADDCQYPTFDEIMNYYKSNGITGIDDVYALSLQAFIDAIIGTNGLAASVVWHAMNTMVLYILYAEGTFLGKRGTKWISIFAGNGELVPNNDWMILCDCAPNTKVWDFSLGNELGWVAQGDSRAIWSGDGWTPKNMGYANTIVIERAFTWPVDLVITDIRVYMDNPSSANFNYAYGMPYVNGLSAAALPITGGFKHAFYKDKGTRTGIGVEFSDYVVSGQKITRIEADYEGTAPLDW